MDKACHINVTGLVQGVGFRPFVYRIAGKHNLSGWVKNTNECVEIFIQGPEKSIRNFLDELRSDPPAASHIENVEVVNSEPLEIDGFRITRSADTSRKITEISPDIAVCNDCLEDMHIQPNRVHYPFINCTNCGPRFTIISELPYDRQNTSMKVFPMCSSCRAEYSEVNDRRFHAQPVACENCGPYYTLVTGNRCIEGTDAILQHLSKLINEGGIIAMKGLGGFHLLCDATNEAAVDRLRKVKNREGKPFAVMFPGTELLRKYAEVSPLEEKTLLSWRRPIVLLKNAGKNLAPGVCVGLNTVGAMLPYLPFHHLLFEHFNFPIVLTSGNLSNEPIIIDNTKAIQTFSAVTDGVLIYNREIVNRTDDSIIRVMRDVPSVFRRSRGFVPSPVGMKLNTEGILATGAEQVNTFCIGKGNYAIPSQYTGDLQNTETTVFYSETVDKFSKLFRMNPQIIVSDLHPEYFTTKFAISGNKEIKHIRVQHHHAHIASCMAEHGLDEPVIGVAFDGTGYGTDGNIWGGEFLFCELQDFTRYTHFKYIPLPGGDRAIEEPWRIGISYLFKIFGEEFRDLGLPFINNLSSDKLDFILKMLRSGINCPLASSAGRLFDAVAAMLSLCTLASFPAEAPMRLESIIEPGCVDKYPYTVYEEVDFDQTIAGIVEDIRKKGTPGIISAKFHNTVISVIFEVVNAMSEHFHCHKVVLSGGTFQNKYLLEGVIHRFIDSDITVYTHRNIPANDGGISLGQLAIAAKRRQLCV
jgi:hydrogenase maturation protein HypF